MTEEDEDSVLAEERLDAHAMECQRDIMARALGRLAKAWTDPEWVGLPLELAVRTIQDFAEAALAKAAELEENPEKVLTDEFSQISIEAIK